MVSVSLAVDSVAESEVFPSQLPKKTQLEEEWKKKGEQNEPYRQKRPRRGPWRLLDLSFDLGPIDSFDFVAEMKGMQSRAPP